MKFLLLVALLLAAPGACTGPPPQDQPKPAAPRSVIFRAEVLNAQAEQLARRVSLTVTAIQTDGSIANVVDPDSGEIHPGPLVIIRTTPWQHTSTLGPGVHAVSFAVDYLGVKGEIVQCYATVDGVEISRSATQITVSGPGGRGHATTSCEYIGA